MIHSRKNSFMSLAILAVVMIGCTKNDQLLPTKVEQKAGRMFNYQSGLSAHLPINIQEAKVEDLSVHQFVQPVDTTGSIDSLTASRIFHDVQSQGAQLWGRYFTDGQFAYASAIRRYIEAKYHLVCRKLFIFGDLTAVSPRYDCAASWKYDVACVLPGKNGVYYVIDPRLFARVVTDNVWTEAHTHPTYIQPNPSSQPQKQFLPGAFFAPTNDSHTQYINDSVYQYTDIMLEYYSDSVGCSCQQIM